MASKRYRKYIFSNDELRFMTHQEALTYARDNDLEIVHDGLKAAMRSPKRMKKDGFRPGWQPNLGRYVGGRLEYNKILKERGLVEVGNEEMKQIEDKETIGTSPDAIRAAKEMGAEISDNEADALIGGTFDQ